VSMLSPSASRTVARACVELCWASVVTYGCAAGRCDRPHAERLAQLKSGSYTVHPIGPGRDGRGRHRRAHRACAATAITHGAAFALRDEVLRVWGDPAITATRGDDLRRESQPMLLSLAAPRLSGTAASTLRKLDRRQ
jgi:geranylgeranyl pyrophosphate synthase